MRRLLPSLLCSLIWIIIGCADPAPTASDADGSASLRSGAVATQNDDEDTDADDAVECKFKVPLEASQEVPPRASQASGVAEIEIEGDEIKFEIEIDNPAGESFLAGHIHEAPRGVNGPVRRFLYPNVQQNTEFEASGFPAGEELRVKGEGSIDPVLAARICSSPELFYVNFHTTDFPGGAIRGQLR